MGNYKRLIGPIKEMYKMKRLVADWHGKEQALCQLLDEIRLKYNEEAAEYCENAFPEETEDYTDVFLVTVVDDGHPYSVLVHEKDKEKALAIIKDAIKEYNQDNACFHDEVTGLLPDDLCRIFFSEAEFPVIKYFMPEPPKYVGQGHPSPMEGKVNMEYRDTAPLFGVSFLD